MGRFPAICSKAFGKALQEAGHPSGGDPDRTSSASRFYRPEYGLSTLFNTRDSKRVRSDVRKTEVWIERHGPLQKGFKAGHAQSAGNGSRTGTFPEVESYMLFLCILCKNRYTSPNC